MSAAGARIALEAECILVTWLVSTQIVIACE